jgi:peptidoglycan/xylan/chitin deacetylase (PgdA/CDA1 family)
MKLYLMLHGLGPPPTHLSAVEKLYWTGIDRFKAIVEMARRAPERIILTFDDGNQTDVQIALPILQQAGLQAHFFLLAGRISRPGYLNEGDILALHRAGMTIGSHGIRHVAWTTLKDDALLEQIQGGVRRLESIVGEPITDAAIPFGECDFRIARTLRRAGIDRVFSSFHGPTLDGDWLVRRECVTVDIPLTTIEDWMFRRYHAGDVVYSFLRAAKHVGPAALWRRP